MKKTEYLFTSKRLGFRTLKESDFENYFKLDSDPEVRAFFPKGTLSAKQVKENIKKNIAFYKIHGFGVYVVIELDTGEFVGRCGFGEIETGEIEVGYVFLKKFWGKGFATEALVCLLDFAKQHIKKDKIIAFTPANHSTSIQVMKKSGMDYYKKENQGDVELIFYMKNLTK